MTEKERKREDESYEEPDVPRIDAVIFTVGVRWVCPYGIRD
jgi:hypothetical protein